MKRNWFAFLLCTTIAGALAGCSHLNSGSTSAPEQSSPAVRALLVVSNKYAPDGHVAIFKVGLDRRERSLVLTGYVDRAEAKLDAVQAVQRVGGKVTDRVQVLPDAQLGDKLWGISRLSVACGREQPGHPSEMGTQVLMGDVVRLWKESRSTNGWPTWTLAQSADGYVAWLEAGTFIACTREQVEAWQKEPRLIVTALEDTIWEQPRCGAQPVSDVVVGNLVKKTGETGEWFGVELPDGRSGFLAKHSAEDYAAWKQARRPTPENIERSARRLLGRPYLWGSNSPKGLDCSGFTKLVFFLNGMDLKRNASEQVHQGDEVPLDAQLSQLKKGDLLFFGHREQRGLPEKIVHVGIYLGDKLFIQSSERVQINSLDASSPIRDEHRIRTLVHARRVLPASGS